MINLNGATTKLTYDLMNRLVEESYQDGTVISYTYNLLGQPKTVTDVRGTTIAKHGKVVEQKSGRTNVGQCPATLAMSTIA